MLLTAPEHEADTDEVLSFLTTATQDTNQYHYCVKQITS